MTTSSSSSASVAVSGAVVRSGWRLRTRMRRMWWRHPESLWLAIASVAWLYVLVAHLAGHGEGAGAGWHFSLIDWCVMVLAMMIPVTAPAVRYVALDGMWDRRVRGPALFVATTMVVWAALAVAALLVGWSVGALVSRDLAPSRLLVSGVLVAAAGWQCTPAKRRLLRRCHLRTPLAPRGRKADWAVIRYALVHSRACVGSCLWIMAAMFLAGRDHAHLMLPLTVITVLERRPRADPRPGAAALIALAAGWSLIA